MKKLIILLIVLTLATPALATKFQKKYGVRSPLDLY